jgi:hypothetical protein
MYFLDHLAKALNHHNITEVMLKMKLSTHDVFILQSKLPSIDQSQCHFLTYMIFVCILVLIMNIPEMTLTCSFDIK